MKQKSKLWAILLFSLLVCTLGITQVNGQQRSTLQKEDRYYYVDANGKKKYVSNSKTQKMWTEILEKFPDALAVARKYNVNIYQNTAYHAPNRLVKRDE